MTPEDVAHAVAAGTPWTYDEALRAIRLATDCGIPPEFAGRLLTEAAEGAQDAVAAAVWGLIAADDYMRRRRHSIRTGTLRRDLRTRCRRP